MHFASRYIARWGIKPWVSLPKKKQGYTIEFYIRIKLHSFRTQVSSVSHVLEGAINRYLGGKFEINGHPVEVVWHLSWQKSFSIRPDVLSVYLIPFDILKKDAKAAGVFRRFTCVPGEIDMCTAILLPEDRFSRKISKVNKDLFGKIVGHEIGHALGLKHSKNRLNVMYKNQVKSVAQRISNPDIGQIVRSIIPSMRQPDWLKFGANLQ